MTTHATFARHLTAAVLLWAAVDSFLLAATSVGSQAPTATPVATANAPVTRPPRAPGERVRHPLPPASPPVPPPSFDVADAGLANTWGIRVESMRLTAAGYMLDFRYQVVDARKAKPLFERKIKPVLIDEATGAKLAVPVPPKTGALRNSNEPKAGRSYFMFFANPGHFVKPGSLVTVNIGAFNVTGVRVDPQLPPIGAVGK